MVRISSKMMDNEQNDGWNISLTAKFGKCFKVFTSLMLVVTFILSMKVTAQENRAAVIDGEAMTQHRAKVLDHNGNILDDDVDREAIHPDDSLALIAFYHSMHGDQWINNSGWLELPVDFWVGVEQVENVGTDSEPEWRVTRFTTIDNDNMTVPGVFPAEIGLMTHMQRFRQRSDLVIGELPVEVRYLEQLQRWQVSSNYLTGEIPWDEFSELTRLERFDAFSNYFHGSIPESIGDWQALERMQVHSNQLSGTIPDEVANLENLQRFRIGSNMITGELPDLSGLEYLERIHISGLPLDEGPMWDWLPGVGNTLEQLNIHRTNRTGEIPDWFPMEMTALEEFRVGEDPRDAPENAIGGNGDEIPSLTEMVNLESLGFYGHSFTGEIPDWIGEMLVLEDLTISDTKFEGPIPANLALLNLEQLEFSDNPNITGGIPDEFSDLGSLERLVIDNSTSLDPGDPTDPTNIEQNMEVGQIPDWIGNLTNLERLEFQNVGVTGTLPDLSEITNLERFNVSDNPELTGDIDEEYFASLPLSTFNISRTGLNVSEIPEWLNSTSSRMNLSSLGLDGLGLQGEIPAWLGDMVWLSSLSLSDNNLSGEIPPELGELFQMSSLNLGNNQLSGQIPESIANLGRVGGDLVELGTLILSGNEDLEGTLPIEITDASFMRHLHIDDTRICLPDGAEAWVEGFSEYANNQFPRSYYSAGINEEYCDDPVSSGYDDHANAFELSQNYPNPFNPATTISYEIPVDTHVELYVYSIIGQRVATLVNESQNAGSYQVEFDGTRLASGSYIYRLETSDQTLTRTMMLIK